MNCNLDSSFGTPLEDKYIETFSLGLSYSKTAVQILASLTFLVFSIMFCLLRSLLFLTRLSESWGLKCRLFVPRYSHSGLVLFFSHDHVPRDQLQVESGAAVQW